MMHGYLALRHLTERRPLFVRRPNQANPVDRVFPHPIPKNCRDGDFHDRQHELAIVQAVLSQTTRKPLLVRGERCIGKTTLLNRVRHWLELPPQPGPWAGRDPFAPQKRRQEQEALAQLAAIWPPLAELMTDDPDLAFEALLHSALWGNRADLSNFTVQVTAQVGLAVQEERRHLLIDHTPRLLARLRQGLTRLDIICDNVGLDVLGDLALADFVLGRDWAEQVVMHLKDRPFFVSDAMVADVETAIAGLRSASLPALAALGERLAAYRQAGRLHLTTHPFWSSFRTFADLPADLRRTLEAADLRLFKGDVNYRRLLDDRHWPHTTPFEAVAALFRLPRPLVVLRTLKGEIMVGLQPGQAEALAAAEPDWLINGRRGIIQWVDETDTG
jgi:uncharacterized protein with ATP-grasp and redox domains